MMEETQDDERVQTIATVILVNGERDQWTMNEPGEMVDALDPVVW
jgi:hypothetical protein